MKNPKYPDGYIPKIKYWITRLHEADKAGDLHAKSRAVGKIAGFTQAHIDRYGPIPPGALEIDNP